MIFNRKRKISPLEEYNMNVNQSTKDQLLADELVHIEDLKVPPCFADSNTNRRKILKALRFYKEHGFLDKPITVIAETNEKGNHNKLIVVDGLSRYICARWLKLDILPVVYEDINTYCNKRNI